MCRRIYFIMMLLLMVIFSLSFPYAIYILKVLFFPKHVSILQQLECYQWAAIGLLSYVVVKRYVKYNIAFLEIHAHEWNHTFFALLFNRRIHSLHAEGQSGVVYTSGNSQLALIPISLAPYCFPMFTWLLLSIRFLMNFNGMWIYDILIGLTLGFHYYCLKTQIGNHQTDINQYPLSFSYFYIATAWLINFCIIAPSFFPNMNEFSEKICSTGSYQYGIWSAIQRLGTEWWNNLYTFFIWLF